MSATEGQNAHQNVYELSWVAKTPLSYQKEDL